MTQEPPRVTERQNGLTSTIDVVPTSEKLLQLFASDLEMFQEAYQSTFPPHGALDGLYSERILARIEALSSAFSESDVAILSGCGTSGRFGWLCSRRFNHVLHHRGLAPKYRYCMAGGDKALLKSIEALEDQPAAGVLDVQSHLSESVDDCRATLVGITCGLSAPYVAGQLEYALQSPAIRSVLMGFNPIDLARLTPLRNMQEYQNFRDLAHALEADESSIVVNPIVGPESITGSSRMKGGSETKVLLDAAFAHSLEPAESGPVFYLRKFEQTCRDFYNQKNEPLSLVCEAAGECFTSGGHVYYLSSDFGGMMGMVDASECVPTYGSDFEDIRGFLPRGWTAMGANVSVEEAEEWKNQDDNFKLSLSWFRERYLPTLTSKDLVVVFGMEKWWSGAEDEQVLDEDTVSIMEVGREVALTDAQLYGVFYSSSNQDEDALLTGLKEVVTEEKCFNFTLSEGVCLLPMMPSLGEFALKLTMNAISTLGHVLKGVTFGNLMISLRLSNSKLVVRAQRMLQGVTSCDEASARRCVLRAIYDKDEDEGEEIDRLMAVDNISHSLAAVEVPNVIAIALLLQTGSCETIDQARERLQQTPIVRQIFAELSQE